MIPVPVGAPLISMELSDGRNVLGMQDSNEFFEVGWGREGKAFATPLNKGVYVRKYAFAVTYRGHM